MTTALSTLARPAVFDEVEHAFGRVLAPLRRFVDDRRTYRNTLRELQALSIRQREDLGIVGLDLQAIARGATLGR